MNIIIDTDRTNEVKDFVFVGGHSLALVLEHAVGKD